MGQRPGGQQGAASPSLLQILQLPPSRWGWFWGSWVWHLLRGVSLWVSCGVPVEAAPLCGGRGSEGSSFPWHGPSACRGGAWGPSPHVPVGFSATWPGLHTGRRPRPLAVGCAGCGQPCAGGPWGSPRQPVPVGAREAVRALGQRGPISPGPGSAGLHCPLWPAEPKPGVAAPDLTSWPVTGPWCCPSCLTAWAVAGVSWAAACPGQQLQFHVAG